MPSMGGRKAVVAATALGGMTKKNANKGLKVKGRSGQRRRGTGTMKKG